MSDKTQKQSLREYFLDLLKIIIISLAIILPIRYFIIQPFVVKGSSMEPNFSDGDYLIINEIGYRFQKPLRGDIVVFRYPKDLSQYYIKRIIGLPNEKVEIKNGKVKIYNSKNPEGVDLRESYLTVSLTPGNLETNLSDNEYFVLGDNRFASSDSRVWGVLPRQNIIGKVWLRGWPVAKAQVFRRFLYQLP